MLNVNRRIFLKQGGLACLIMGMGPFWGPRFLRQAAFAADLGSSTDNKVLICIFQRGAVDGLSMVVPYGDSYYYQNRQEISIAAPSQAAGAQRSWATIAAVTAKSSISAPSGSSDAASRGEMPASRKPRSESPPR